MCHFSQRLYGYAHRALHQGIYAAISTDGQLIALTVVVYAYVYVEFTNRPKCEHTFVMISHIV